MPRYVYLFVLGIATSCRLKWASSLLFMVKYYDLVGCKIMPMSSAQFFNSLSLVWSFSHDVAITPNVVVNLLLPIGPIDGMDCCIPMLSAC